MNAHGRYDEIEDCGAGAYLLRGRYHIFDMGIYPQHIPLTAIIAPGVLRIHEGDTVKEAALMSGFIQILKDEVTILAESVEWPDEIDANRAREAEIRAKRRIEEGNGDLDRAELALKRALVRLSLTR